MATIFVLSIEHPKLTNCFDAIRKICNPSSSSTPHVTVRYIDKLEKNDLSIYESCSPNYIDIIGPGSFGLDDEKHKKVVFLRCASEDLDSLEHKPDYPDSVFHITLYDGSSRIFSSQLVEVLEKYKWDFRITLPSNNNLKRIALKKKKNQGRSRIEYSKKTMDLFHEMTGRELSKEVLESLSDDSKISIVDSICRRIMDITNGYEKAKERPSSSGISTSFEPSIDDDASWKKSAVLDQFNQKGLYLTPPELATEIAKHALSLLASNEDVIDFGDPAIGTGVFYSVLCRILPQNRINSAIGIELDPQRAKITEQKWAHKGLKVISGDYLHFSSTPNRNLILANPPYVRYQHINQKYGKILRQKATKESGIKINGQSGLYVYFILASHSWMRVGAISAWLIPAEFMDSRYGSALRSYFTHRVTLKRIHIYDDNSPQFENALVSSCSVFFENTLPQDRDEVFFSYGGSLDQPKQIKRIKLSELRAMERWSFDILFGEEVVTSGPLISELFEVRRGIATGANEYFIMDRTRAPELGIPDIFLKPILPKVRTLLSAVILSEDDGFPAVSPQLVLFDCHLPEKELRETHPSISGYLDMADSLGIKDRTLIGNRKVWTQQEKRSPAPFLCTYMGRGNAEHSPVRFIKNESSALASNTYLLMYPKPRLAALLARVPELSIDLFELLQATEKIVLRIHSRKYGGGLRKIEPRELQNVPLVYTPPWLNDALENRLDFRTDDTIDQN